MNEETKACCICGNVFTGWGNNPWPVKEEGWCCDHCNRTKVIPARLDRLKNKGGSKHEK